MEKVRLCGGTFFTLALQARRQRKSSRDHLKSDSDGLSEPEMLLGLARIIQPEIQMPPKVDSFSTSVNRYKSCKSDNCASMPFDNQQVLHAFDMLVKQNYEKALARMIQFAEMYFDCQTANVRCSWLVNALVEMLEQDDTISDEEQLWVNANGTSVCKGMLCDLKTVHFQSFLLGVFQYAFCRVKNSEGQDTYDVWCPSTGNNKKRVFQSKIGLHSQDVDCIFLSIEETSDEDQQVQKEIVSINQDIESVNSLMISLRPRLRLQQIKKPVEIASKELGYVMPLFEAYGQHNHKTVETKEDLSVRLQADLELRRDDFYAAETVRVEGQNTLGACVLTEFEQVKEEVYHSIKNTWIRDYLTPTGEDDGYLRMLAVMEQAAVAPCEGNYLSKTGWIKADVKQGICHMLTADGKITWVMQDE